MRAWTATLITVSFLCLSMTSARAEPPVMPRDLVEYGRSRGCEPVGDFYDRPGAFGPPYVYGYLPGRPKDSAVFWCQTGQGAGRRFWLMVKRDTTITSHGCADKVEWPYYPGGLSIERVGLASGEFVYLSEWAGPKRVIPETAQLSGNAIQSEYDGVEFALSCYGREWIVRMRH